MSTTPYMLIVLPTPGTSNDFLGENQYITGWSVVDAHDHSSGKGVQVTPAGLLINTDLPFGSNNATLVRSIRFVNNTATLALTADIGCAFVSGGDLYYRNVNGQTVQITSGGSVSGASAGNISGLGSPAAASYASGSGTFTWTSNTNVAAPMDHGPVIIRDTASSALGITLKSPTSLAGAYALTLPTALPGTTQALVVSSAGAISAGLPNNYVTRPMLPLVGQQVSSSSGSGAGASTTSAAYADIFNLTVTFTPTGRPVMLVMQPDGAAVCHVTINSAAQVGQIRLLRDAVTLGEWKYTGLGEFPGPQVLSLDTGASASTSHTWKLQFNVTGGFTFSVQNYVLAAYEL